MNELNRRSESNRRRPRASSENLERPLGSQVQFPTRPERPVSRKGATGSLKFLFALALACTFAYSTAASAQPYSYGDQVMSAQLPAGISVEEAIEEAVDLAYEDLYGELHSEQMLATSCTAKLALTGPGSNCSCSATGPKAACWWNQNNGGQTSTAVCTDGITTTVCSYAPNGTTCGCTTR